MYLEAADTFPSLGLAISYLVFYASPIFPAIPSSFLAPPIERGHNFQYYNCVQLHISTCHNLQYNVTFFLSTVDQSNLIAYPLLHHIASAGKHLA